MTNTRRTAIVTGSSSGIGQAIATRLLESEYNVVANYANDDERGSHTLAALLEVSPSVAMVKADVSRASEAANLIESAVDFFGRIDVLVNNAAVAIDGPAIDMSEEEWDRVIDVNLKGPFLCSQLAARHMLDQHDGGSIINIGSSTGIRGRRNGVNTCASKAGLMIMTQCLALELGPKIRVNTVVPGMTLTEDTERRFGLHDPAVRRGREETVPMGRLGSPDDVADAIMLMLSTEARFVTGQKFVVDGGQYMW